MRKIILMKLGFLLLATLVLAQKDPGHLIFEGGKMNYSIVLGPGTGAPERMAASLLTDYLERISGLRMPLKQKPEPFSIELVRTKNRKGLKDDGFFIRSEGRKIVMGGNDSLSCLHAVCHLLEQYAGLQFLAPDAVIVPRSGQFQLPELDIVSNPAFAFRLNYYGPAFDSAYAAFHGLSNGKRGLQTVHADWGLWVHTMYRFLPPEKYYSAHPEFFAFRNGLRIPDQLCLSNDTVFRITTDSLRVQMRRKPKARYWSVSQMDNFNHCQCQRCRNTDSLAGSAAGSIIRFANRVAAVFPDKVISTLAYQYSRTAPTGIQPLPNVNIMLCSIEEDRAKPIGISRGSFGYDLAQWSRLTDNIIVWDYCINFNHVLMPFPNLKVLKPNLELFRNYGVKMVFEQAWPGGGGEAAPLRAFMLSKLLWNPGLNADSLEQVFLRGYFGTAYPLIQTYRMLMDEELMHSGNELTLYEHPRAQVKGYLSPASLRRYDTLFQMALETAQWDTVLQNRILQFYLPVQYAQLEIAKALPGTADGLFESNASGNLTLKPWYPSLLGTFVENSKRFGNRLLHETRLSPDQYFSQMNTYFERGVVNNKADGAQLSYTHAFAPQYDGGGSKALVDGFRATDNYQFLWQGFWEKDMQVLIDLGRAQVADTLSGGFLQDHQSWIFLPASVQVEWAGEDRVFQKGAVINLPMPKGREPALIRDLEIPLLNRGAAVRYIRVTAANPGDLPAWHGAQGHTWIFCDELFLH